MSTLLRKGIVVCEEPDLIDYFKKYLHGIDCTSSTLVRSHDLSGTIVVVKPYLDEACGKWGKHCEYVKKRSLLTGRMMPGESVPVRQPPNTIILPWCDEVVFVNWVAMLLGFPDATIYPEWFFFRTIRSDSSSSKTVHNLFTVLQGLPTWSFHELKSANIAEKVGCSKRYLEKIFDALFGIMPGQLLRGWRNFVMTTNLMSKEKVLEKRGRRGFSPLAEIDNDYRRSLVRLLGITFTELRHAAIKEHWAAVWMRKWRETLLTIYDASENICNKNKGGKYSTSIYNHFAVQ